MGTFAKAIGNGENLLEVFATEIRLMIFKELLIVWPKTIFRGAQTFGPLDEKEIDDEIPFPWQILLTCRKYYEEAVPIIYGGNKLVFCTGEGGGPGEYWRFPVPKHHMRYLKDVGIYFRADDPKNQGSQRVAHFIKALARLATSLDILFCDHPVCKALDRLVQAQTVKHLKLRVHDGAAFYPQWALYLNQTFQQNGADGGRSITFSCSCSCPSRPGDDCVVCGWPKVHHSEKPIEVIVPPEGVEASQDHLMDLQWNLFEMGLLPPSNDDMEDEDTEDADDSASNGSGFPWDDDYEEMRKAFDSGLLLMGQKRHWRGEMIIPKVYSYRQTELTEFLKFVEYDQYLRTTFRLD